MKELLRKLCGSIVIALSKILTVTVIMLSIQTAIYYNRHVYIYTCCNI